MHHRHIARAALIVGVAGAAWCTLATLDGTAAQAAATPGALPGVVDQLGELVDSATSTVEQLPHPVKLARPSSAPQLAQRALDDEPVRAAVEQVRDTVGAVVAVVPQPATPPDVTPPDVTPPLPPSPATPPASAAPDAVPAVVLLPGPAPSTVTVDPTRPAARPAAAGYFLPCDSGQSLSADTLRHRRTPSPTWTQCTPAGQIGTTNGLPQVKPPSKTGADLIAAITPYEPAILALRLLGELLPRSDLPTGRTERPEPGPA